MKFAPGAWRYALPPLLAAPFALLIDTRAAVVAAALGGAVLGFFRDPDRTPPPRGVVSPADGKVSVLREESIDGESRVRLGVFMNVWNVHVVRAPFDGTVADVEHTPGANRPAFSKDSDRNERVHVRFAEAADADREAADDGHDEASIADSADATDGTDDAESEDAVTDGAKGDDAGTDTAHSDREVTMVAGAFARRIHPYVERGTTVDRGERIGHIAFGSRVDVVFPAGVEIDDVRVSPGDRVRAGETVVFDRSANGATVDPESAIEREMPDEFETSGGESETAVDDGERSGGDRSWT